MVQITRQLMASAQQALSRRANAVGQAVPPAWADGFIHARERIDRPLELDLTVPSWRSREVINDTRLLDPAHTNAQLVYSWPDFHYWRLRNSFVDIDSSLVFARDRVVAQSGTGTRASTDSAFISGAYARYRSQEADFFAGKCAPVGDMQHHYHFVAETLPRLLRIQQEEPNAVFVSSQEPYPFAAELLRALGITIRRVPPGTVLAPEEVMIVDQPIKFWPRASDLTLLRRIPETLHINQTVTAHAAIYISRSEAERSPAGEREFQQQLAKVGIPSVLLETGSPEDQIRTVLAARALIGVHGAGLASLAFMPLGATVIELSSGDRYEACYQRMAIMLGLDYGFVQLPSSADHPHGVIPQELLGELLQMVQPDSTKTT